MKITAIEPIGVSGERMQVIKNQFADKGHQFYYFSDRETEPENLKEQISDSEVIILTNQPLKGDVIRCAPNLKMISVAFTGVDHIDMEACREKGITVSNAAGFSDQAVAELSVGLMIDLLRKVTEQDALTRKGKMRIGPGRELGGKTVGIIGTGRIGLHTAKLLQTFGCSIIAYSRTRKERAVNMGIKYVSLEELMKNADIVSVHTPLNKETKGLVGQNEIEMMKPTTILINTARGPVVDYEALAEALNSGKVAGAGLDVYEVEPPLDTNHPILKAKNTVTLPHIGFATEEGILLRSEIVVENILSWIGGEPVRVMN